jgi:2'-5' RNA ligase
VRLFVALMPPPDVLDEIEELVAPRHDDWPDLRWVRRDFMHITLAFLGEADERSLDRLLPRLERVAARSSALELSFAGIGAFPRGGAHARVLWTGLYGDERALSRMSASAYAGGRRAGLPVGETKPFRPHLTLARCRRPADVRPLLENLAGFTGSTWTAGTLHLVRSHLGSDRRYETLRTWTMSKDTKDI